MKYSEITSMDQLVNGLKIEGLQFNSGTDHRSIFDLEYSDIIEREYEIDGDHKSWDNIYDLIELEIENFEYDLTDDYGIKVHFMQDDTDNGTFGGLRQQDALDSRYIEITDYGLFTNGLKLLIDFCNSNPTTKWYDGSFHEYVEYNGCSIVYDRDAETIGDYLVMYMDYLSSVDSKNSYLLSDILTHIIQTDNSRDTIKAYLNENDTDLYNKLYS